MIAEIAEKIRAVKAVEIRRDVLDTVKTVAGQVAAFALCAVTAQGEVFGSLSPFGVAVAAGLNRYSALSGFAGAALGYVLTRDSSRAFRYLACTLMTALLCVFLTRIIKKRSLREPMLALACFLGLTLTGVAATAAQGVGVIGILRCFAEGLTGGGSTYFIACALSVRTAKINYRALSPSQLTGVLVLAATVLLCASEFDIYGFIPARAAGCIIILLAARYGSEKSGSIAGICVGAITGFSGKSPVLAACYSLAGLMSGLCGRFGRLPACAAFICGAGVMLLASGESELFAPVLAETAAAGIVVMLLPKKLCSYLRGFFVTGEVSGEGECVRTAVSLRLKSSASAAAEVSQCVDTVAKTLARLSSPSSQRLYDSVREQVCAGCKRKSICWDVNADKTLNALNELALRIKSGDKPGSQTPPEYLSSRCRSVGELTAAFDRLYCEHSAAVSAEGRIAEARSVAADQFLSVSAMLENIADELSDDTEYDLEAARAAASALEGAGITVLDALCSVSPDGHRSLQIFCSPGRGKVAARSLAKAVSEAVGTDFSNPVIGERDREKVLLLMSERPPLKAEIAGSQYIGDSQSVSGDAYEHFYDGRGHYIIVLSDGMGTGNRAAVDSSMAMGLTVKLLKAGFGADCVLKIVNSALMVKSREESLATLDIAQINLYTGELKLFKAGAAPSLIVRKGKVIRIERSSMPLGILRDVGFERISAKLAEGDMLVMMSDGAMGVSPGEIGKAVCLPAEEQDEDASENLRASSGRAGARSFAFAGAVGSTRDSGDSRAYGSVRDPGFPRSSGSPQFGIAAVSACAERIASLARDSSPGARVDDITVICAAVK